MYATVIIHDGNIVHKSKWAKNIEYVDGVLTNTEGPSVERPIYPQFTAYLSDEEDGMGVVVHESWVVLRVIPTLPEEGFEDWPNFPPPSWDDVGVPPDAYSKIRRIKQLTNPTKLVEMLERFAALSLSGKVIAEELSDEDKAALVDLFPQYEVGKAYKIGDVFGYEGSLYEVLQDHTSQADWPPDTTASLYKAHTPSGVIEEWVQPQGSHDAYMLGDVVTHDGKTWESLINDNVWQPGTAGTESLWAEI